MVYLRWLQKRENGLLHALQDEKNMIMKNIYGSMDSYHCWDGVNDKSDMASSFGGIFNLEFSPNGNVLVAACEKRSILLFDAITTKQTYKVTDAHTNNVNCIKFLDDRNFATCSDDNTVALWDLRYLKKKVRSLQGHSNWVKNIEYSHKDNLLVTSGFDGSIFTWDINSHTEQGLIYQKVFHTSGLMRCRISPDGTKLVICTTGGYLMIIHNLDLTTLHKDLSGFRPIIYRLMQMGHQHIPQAAKFDHVFSKKQKKNRVELVSDFPTENDAEVILALQIHPHGHSFLSRNISYDESTEWSCVHDIYEEPEDITERLQEPSEKRKRKHLTDDGSGDDSIINNSDDDLPDNLRLTNFNFRRNRNRVVRPNATAPTAANAASNNGNNSNNSPAVPPRSDTFVPDIWAAEVTVQERAIRQTRARTSNSVTGYNFVYAISSGVLPQAATSRPIIELQRPARRTLNSTSLLRNSARARVVVQTSESDTAAAAAAGDEAGNGSSTSSSDSPPHIVPFERLRRRRSLISHLNHNPKRDYPIFQNPKKLQFYIQESTKGKGFIKEPCFSADGRIVCSPYDTGVRLLAFGNACPEYPRHQMLLGSEKPAPQILTEIKTINAHSDIVLSTKFSPREPLLVTGCRSGKLVWYHTNL